MPGYRDELDALRIRKEQLESELEELRSSHADLERRAAKVADREKEIAKLKTALREQAQAHGEDEQRQTEGEAGAAFKLAPKRKQGNDEHAPMAEAQEALPKAKPKSAGRWEQRQLVGCAFALLVIVLWLLYLMCSPGV